jgi:hypothetical protein
VGHKKWECTASVRTNAVDEDVFEEQEMMGVWQIGNVETYAEKPIAISNKYDALTHEMIDPDEGDEDDDEIGRLKDWEIGRLGDWEIGRLGGGD